jgi:hypothetical protein
MRSHSISRWISMLALAGSAGLLVACDEVLTVNNPQEIPTASLEDSTLINSQVVGVVAAFAEEYTQRNGAILWSANFLTDEQVTGLNWEDYARVNQRIVNYTEGPVTSLWGGLNRIIRLGEDTSNRIEELTGKSDDRRIAQTAVLTGYGYVLAGESMCFGVFGPASDPGTELVEPLEMFQRAIPWFQRAITIGSATGQTDIVNLAHVGLARAYLSLKDFPKVISEASAVPASFKYWVNYSAASPGQNNGLYGNIHGSNHNMGVSPWFLQGTWLQQNIIATQTDPRIQHVKSWAKGHNALTPLYKPFQGLRFSGYSGETQAPPSASCPRCTGAVPASSGDTGPLLLYQKDTNVLLADYLEAQHHLMEAKVRQGGSDAEVLAFVNARRFVGNENPVTLSGSSLFTELRRQRSRDFYQGGFRLGDLRRWKRDGVGDFFPTGNHVNAEWGAYGTWTCYPLPLEEYEGNPGLPKPADPLTPPPGV